jgi:hypothetical protein
MYPIEVNRPDGRTYHCFLTSDILKSEIQGDVGRACPVEQPGRNPVVLHEREPIDDLFISRDATEILMGSTLKLKQEMALMRAWVIWVCISLVPILISVNYIYPCLPFK